MSMFNTKSSNVDIGGEWKPNLFVPGFTKCGTTALCEYLSQHPQIYVIKGKEPCTLTNGQEYPKFWTINGLSLHATASLSINMYKRLFYENRMLRYRVDGSTVYGYKPEFAYILKKFNNRSKCILMIRDQITRLISTYLFSYHYHKQNDFFIWLQKFCIPFIDDFFFYDKVATYYEVYKKDLLVIENKTLIKYPNFTMNKVFDFLDLEPIPIKPLRTNVNIYSSFDNKIYKEFVHLTTSIASIIGKITKWGLLKLGLLNDDFRYIYRNWDPSIALELFYQKIIGMTRTSNDYTKLIKQLPNDILTRLRNDYTKTIKFCNENDILCLTID